MFLVSLILVLYLTMLGYVTVLERKVLAIIQIRRGVSRTSPLSFYHFYLDFLKVLLKGCLGKILTKHIHYLLFLFLIFLSITCSFMFLPFNFIGLEIPYGVLFFTVFDITLVIFKVFLLNTLFCKIIFVFTNRLKYIFIFLESITIITPFFLLLVLSHSTNYSWKSLLNLITRLSRETGFIIGVVFLFILLVVIIRLFRCPFDYFEVESELVGGGVLEFHGVGFATWSLLEYGLILNNSLFILCILHLVIGGFSLTITLLPVVLFLILFSRGVLVRVRFFSVFSFILKTYLVVSLLLFLMISLFFLINLC